MPFPVDIKFINEAERKLGTRFPASFVVRMSKDNGGEFVTRDDSWRLHSFLDTSDRTRLKRTCKDIVSETRKARERPDFPPNAVAIAANSGGELLILLPRLDAPDVLGPIYRWDPHTGNVDLVRDDFNDVD
jgi:hypothetical protein